MQLNVSYTSASKRADKLYYLLRRDVSRKCDLSISLRLRHSIIIKILPYAGAIKLNCTGKSKQNKSRTHGNNLTFCAIGKSSQLLSQRQIQEGGKNNCPTKSMSFQASIESHVRAINKM